MLEDIAAVTQFELTEIDIRNNPVIFEKYRYRIPVIIINDEEHILEGRIEFRDMAQAFHLRLFCFDDRGLGGRLRPLRSWRRSLPRALRRLAIRPGAPRRMRHQ